MDRPAIGLVLGSGGFRGPAHVGVLARLQSLGVPVQSIVGCSVGGIVGAYYAGVGLPVDQLIDHAFGVRSLGLVSHALCMRFPERSGARIRRWAEPIRGRLDLLEACDFRRLHHGVEKIGFLSYDLVRRERIFAATGRERGLTLSEAVRASARVPMVFPPLRKFVDGLDRKLIDGGLACPTPVGHAVATPISATHVIAVHLSNSRSRARYNEFQRWVKLLGNRLIVLRPRVRGRPGRRGGGAFIRAWYRAGWESVGPDEATRLLRWARDVEGAAEIPTWPGRSRAAVPGNPMNPGHP